MAKSIPLKVNGEAGNGLLVSRLPDEAPDYEWSPKYDQALRDAYRLIAEHLYGDRGRFAYAAFEYINATYFEGKIPEPLLLWDITDYGACLGWTRSPKDGPPIIKLHPGTVDPVVTNPW